ncbi:hypothetical protein KKC13_11025 [bacterium]|nr:hypothetical protein [bacterium]MBU1958172.1 hypothetical protein [bacterium]
MKVHNKLFLTGYSLTLCFALVGCGGGATSTAASDDSTPPVSKTTYSVSGTVPGTLIEAFCKNGSYYSVNSTDDGSTNHPFTLELPKEVDCKFIMTTNEKDVDTSKHIVTPLLFNNGTTTSSYFQLSDDLDIGHVPLPMSGEGIQAPLTVSNSKVQVNSFSYDPLDTDNDGIPNVYEDDDNDGVVNKYDEDDDNDGILDTEDSDYANDSDGDGIENSYDQDDDNDSLNDSDDDDDDNDNIKDTDDDDYDSSNTTTTTTVVLPITYKADAGRLLGSQCAQCHGTNGISVNEWDSIAGEGDLANEIFEDDEPIMSAQAHGYTSEEITLIGNWLKTL